MSKNKKSKKAKRPWLKCPECESKNYYWRMSSNSAACRKCGTVFNIDYVSCRTSIVMSGSHLISKLDSE